MTKLEDIKLRLGDHIVYKNGFVKIIDDDDFELWFFEKGKYYKNMELDKEYSLEELGL